MICAINGLPISVGGPDSGTGLNTLKAHVLSLSSLQVSNVMIRTHIYITEEQARDIKLRAKRQRRRESDIARELLERGRFISQGHRQESIGEALLRLAEVGKKFGLTGPTDLSTNLDDYLYGDKQ